MKPQGRSQEDRETNRVAEFFYAQVGRDVPPFFFLLFPFSLVRFLIIFACVSFFPIVQMQLSGARAFWQVTSARLSCYFYWRCRACTRGRPVNTRPRRTLVSSSRYIHIYTRWERNDSPGAWRCWSIDRTRQNIVSFNYVGVLQEITLCDSSEQ